jgi:hypothetical protein
VVFFFFTLNWLQFCDEWVVRSQISNGSFHSKEKNVTKCKNSGLKSSLNHLTVSFIRKIMKRIDLPTYWQAHPYIPRFSLLGIITNNTVFFARLGLEIKNKTKQQQQQQWKSDKYLTPSVKLERRRRRMIIIMSAWLNIQQYKKQTKNTLALPCPVRIS